MSTELLPNILHQLQENFKVSEAMIAPLAQRIGQSEIELPQLKAELLQLDGITENMVQQCVALSYGINFKPSLDKVEVQPEFTKNIPIRYAKRFGFFPTSMDDETLWVATSDPEVKEPIWDIGQKFNRNIICELSTHQAIIALINRAYQREESTSEHVGEVIDSVGQSETSLWGIEEPEDLLDAKDEEPIKRMLNGILYQAANNNTSDIHIDGTPSDVIVRFRMDGDLHQTLVLPRAVQRTLINRIKIMSRLDISQRGLPQDGRTLILIAGKRIDIRISIIPTVHGEKAVMRLLYQDTNVFGLSHLGMPPNIHDQFMSKIHQSGGIALVTGPTGSGKTTTLYSALNEIDRVKYNIMTIEDPVEYKIPGYVQIEVNQRLGLTFSHALRSVLRQDPDVIMVGEMRDKETAEIAIQASLTGHSVFSTVHTNSAAATITRLVDMGVDGYLVSATVNVILAQRLLRRLCSNCKVPLNTEEKASAMAMFNSSRVSLSQNDTIYRPQGCLECKSSGYKGRIGLFELLVVTDNIKDALQKSHDSSFLRDVAINDGMKTMRQYGIDHVKEGITSVEEVWRVTYD